MSELFNSDRFSHKESPYERPLGKHRCGRAAIWGKPCSLGPNPDGSCGGVSECRPFRNKNGWECRRASGACASGPNPDGTCCTVRSPCSPVPTVRVLRGRLTFIASMLAIAFLGVLLLGSETHQGSTLTKSNLLKEIAFAWTSPGDLSDVHHSFSSANGCQTCHILSNDETTEGFAVVALRQDIQAGCETCHEFSGPARQPHNMPDAKGQIKCVSCHTEHKGRFANTTEISDQQCASCHENNFTSFASHVDFGERFPHKDAGSIVFDHAQHLEHHFQDKDVMDMAPASCEACHQPEGALNRVEVAGFEESCSACHLGNIIAASTREFALLGLPKLKLKTNQELAAFSQCGAEPGKKFKAAGRSKSSSFLNWLLGTTEKKAEDYATQYCELIEQINAVGPGALIAKMQSRGVDTDPSLLAGLSHELLNQLAQHWQQNDRYRAPDYKLPKGVKEQGWYVNKKGDLNYKPLAHADPVAKAWVEFAISLKQSADDKLAINLASSILSVKKGVGACLKCHTESTTPDNKLMVTWSFEHEPSDHRFVFNHSAHLGLVAVGDEQKSSIEEISGCGVCHKLNRQSEYAELVRDSDAQYQSNFHAIEKASCNQCHSENNIRADCRLCHQYHNQPKFKIGVGKMIGEIQ